MREDDILATYLKAFLVDSIGSSTGVFMRKNVIAIRSVVVVKRARMPHRGRSQVFPR